MQNANHEGGRGYLYIFIIYTLTPLCLIYFILSPLIFFSEKLYIIFSFYNFTLLSNYFLKFNLTYFVFELNFNILLTRENSNQGLHV
jgi:hypothetical protein